MQKFDTAVVLGSRPLGPDSWDLPDHIFRSLDRANELLRADKIKYITLCGKWTINFDVLGIEQPFQECDAMAEYLVDNGVEHDVLLREDESKDTISNIFYLKRQILQPHNFNSLLFIAAQPRIRRIQILAHKILGNSYELEFEGVDCSPEERSNNEDATLQKQSAFLEPMTDGDESWLENKFFEDPFYIVSAERVKREANDEPFMALATGKNRIKRL